jgi:hypothetical protein
MRLEIGLWRIDHQPQRVVPHAMPTESRLEELIEGDPTVLGEPVLLIGRQVPTAHGKFIDLLGISGDGVLQVLELKRDRTPREVVAQALDYGSSIGTLSHDDVLEMFASYRPGVAFEEAFADRFGISPPEELNTGHRLTVVASEVDPATARIVEYLKGFDVPINVMFFRYFIDDGREYVARTWLVAESGSAEGPRKTKATALKEPWNGQDWYVSFGEYVGGRAWEDARRYGFVSAGGGRWYSHTLRSLPLGARIFVCIPNPGYVGVGEVVGEAVAFEEATLPVDGTPTKMADLPLDGVYAHDFDAEDSDEYVVPVRWIRTVPRAEAVWEKGFFANQNSACKLRNRFTLEELVKRFELGGVVGRDSLRPDSPKRDPNDGSAGVLEPGGLDITAPGSPAAFASPARAVRPPENGTGAALGNIRW